ncbi:HIT family hydrolase, diadenosine tetraphosphate hydrolase [Belliella baltica DSM 15883]|uniref:HIT family hydrolase, diadenosine tetraphosphate hydrolase n=1 Tax=Belliella baltica (strain DSM 15883 / CIP 108006 / LMG 21964 / BA134) TaxID=866536 RepID=I3Z9F3_BELBD|nr:HIT family protein [Belliella baltica]AFL85871.1 HIT family hydrolase, diadenosine tetraphosphate hydrolase [Belliella baltica DSM 15883]
MASIFTKIINREIPAEIIAEDENFIAFLDIMPLVKGHVLVVPKQEVDYIFNLEDEVLTGLHIFAKKVAKAIDKTIKCTRVGVAVIGLEVPHVHIHLVPLRTMDDINFTRPKLKLTSEELKEIGDRIRKGIPVQ